VAEITDQEVKMMMTTVVFDLDDTLYDEIEYCRSGLATVAEFLADSSATLSAGSIFTALWDQFMVGNRSKTFNSALDVLGVPYDKERICELVGIYRSHMPKIILPDDSREVLSELKTDYTLALLTDGFLPAQKFKVQALGIEEYFKIIIYTEELGRECWKPSPVGFEKLMQTLNEVPSRMVYVADNEKKDFITPNTLGFSTVQLIRPARIHTSSARGSDTAAHHVIHQISLLPALLKRL
jgi:putative hydrolase of the HAD superfamily